MAAAPDLRGLGPQNSQSVDDEVMFHLRRQGTMESRRANLENHWRQVAERVLPSENIFNRNWAGSITLGERRTEHIFDSTAPNALPRFASAMESLLTPRTQKWHKVTADAWNKYTRQLAAAKAVKVYFQDLTDCLFKARYAVRANYASQRFATYTHIGAFGNAAMFVDEEIGKGLRFQACHMVEIFWQENFCGVIDTLHRKYPMTARQMIQKWGLDGVPTQVQRAYENPSSMDREFDVLHVVLPQADRDPQRMDAKGMPFASYYIAMTEKYLLERGGYRTFPYSVGRYQISPREEYGRSPAMTALADIKTANEMTKTILRAGQRAVDPPILLPEDGILTAFSLRSGALNYGGIDEKGNEMAKAFQSGAKIPDALQLLEGVKKEISTVFLADLWQMLTEHPDMTATQALLIAQQQGMLYGPIMGRQQSEMLGPEIEREIDILGHAGQLPPPPPELIELGGLYAVEYSSPLNLLQKAQEGVGILNTLQALQIIPGAARIFDPVKTGRRLAEINGVPDDLILDDDELAAQDAANQQQQQAQMLAAAAPGVTQSIKNLAQAGQIAQNVPQPIQQ